MMNASESSSDGPHSGAQLLTAGVPIEDARRVLLLIHGRGAPAQSMITLADELQLDATAFLAPQAVGHTWYPYGFMEPVERNEPFLRSALQLIDSLLVELNGRGVAESAVYLLGFSQGACLSLEYAARSGRRFGGVYALSGGLIGDVLDESIYSSSLSGTPYFLGCSDVDPHIPLERLEQSRTILGSRGAAVELRVYPGMGHTVNEDELDRIRNLAMR